MKKFLSILLAFVMLFSLAGCGEDSDTTNGANNNANTNQETEPVKKVNVRYKTEYPYLDIGNARRTNVYENDKPCYYITKDGKLYGNDVEIESSVCDLGFFRSSHDYKYLDKVLQQNGTISEYYSPDLEKKYDMPDITELIGNDLALKNDGTIVSFDDDISKSVIRDCLTWSDIVAVSESSFSGYIVGLKADGTVVATGENSNSQCDVEGWNDIIAVYTFECSDYSSFGPYAYTMAIKSDGTLIYTDGSDDCSFIKEAGSTWTDIVALSASEKHIMGLKSDGTVVSCGKDSYGETKVSDWTDIVAIKAFKGISVGIKADGSVVSAGDDYLIDTYLKDVKLKVD